MLLSGRFNIHRFTMFALQTLACFYSSLHRVTKMKTSSKQTTRENLRKNSTFHYRPIATCDDSRHRSGFVQRETPIACKLITSAIQHTQCYKFIPIHQHRSTQLRIYCLYCSLFALSCERIRSSGKFLGAIVFLFSLLQSDILCVAENAFSRAPGEELRLRVKGGHMGIYCKRDELKIKLVQKKVVRKHLIYCAIPSSSHDKKKNQFISLGCFPNCSTEALLCGQTGISAQKLWLWNAALYLCESMWHMPGPLLFFAGQVVFNYQRPLLRLEIFNEVNHENSRTDKRSVVRMAGCSVQTGGSKWGHAVPGRDWETTKRKEN